MKRNMVVVAPAFFPDEATRDARCWIFLRSCRNFDIPVYLYGTPCAQYPGLTAMRISVLAEVLKTLSGCRHVLVTDAWDAFFTAPLETIWERYEAAGSPPMLMAASRILGNVQDVDASPYRTSFDRTQTYPYPDNGGYIGERATIIEVLSNLDRSRSHDDTYAWIDAWKDNRFRPMLDYGHQIFQNGVTECEIRDGRLVNTVTNSFPCVLHFGGGYVSGETGKDDRMRPWARSLGIIP